MGCNILNYFYFYFYFHFLLSQSDDFLIIFKFFNIFHYLLFQSLINLLFCRFLFFFIVQTWFCSISFWREWLLLSSTFEKWFFLSELLLFSLEESFFCFDLFWFFVFFHFYLHLMDMELYYHLIFCLFLLINFFLL